MKNSTHIILIALLLSCILFIAGLYTYHRFFEWMLPHVDGVIYQSYSITAPFWMSLAYSLALALIPIATVLTWKFTATHSVAIKTLICMVIIGGMTFATIGRHEWVRYKATQLHPAIKSAGEPVPGTVFVSFPVNEVLLERYMLIGLVAGTLIAFFVFRQPKPPHSPVSPETV